jgi:hypothetical protein
MNLNIDQRKIAEFCRNSGISYLALFGSQARGEARESSDVDLLVDFSEEKSLLDHVRLENNLEKLLGRKVDMVTRRSLHPYIKKYVMDDIEPLYGER